MEVNENRKNRQKLERQVTTVVNNVFQQDAQVSIHWDLQNARTEHTGTYVSVFVHTPSVTREAQNALREQGLHFVEQAAHITENPNMDDDIENIPRDELSDAAETDTELVLELERDFIQSAV